MALSEQDKANLDRYREVSKSPWDYAKEYGSDIGQAIPAGIKEGIASIPAVGGDTYDLLAGVHGMLRKWAGDDPQKLKELQDYYESERLLPNSKETIGAVGKDLYEPTTRVGKLVKTAMSLVSGGAVKHLGRDVVYPALGAEFGPDVGEAVAGEKGRDVGGLVAPLALGPLDQAAKQVTTRVIRGPLDNQAATQMKNLQGVSEPLTNEGPNARAERIRDLQKRGIDITGGQATGNRMLKNLEIGPFGGKSAAWRDRQAGQITSDALKSLGISGDTASPEVLHAAQQRFGQGYEELIRRSNGLTLDPQLETALVDIGSRFEDLKGTAQGTAVERYFNRIINASTQHGGAIPPDVFQAINSELSATIADAAAAPDLAPMRNALVEMRDQLYEAVGRNSTDELADQARDLNNRYRNFKIVEDSVGGGGEGASFGQVSPGKLRAAVEKRDPSGYRQGQGDLAGLARSTQSLTDLPDSGTGGKVAVSGVPGFLGTLPMAAVAATLTAKPVRTSIVSRAAGDHPGMFSPLPHLGQTTPGLLRDTLYDEEPVPVELPEDEAPDQRSMLQPGGIEAPEIVGEPGDYGGDPRAAAYAAQQEMDEERQLAAAPPPRRMAANMPLAAILGQSARGGGRMVG